MAADRRREVRHALGAGRRIGAIQRDDGVAARRHGALRTIGEHDERFAVLAVRHGEQIAGCRDEQHLQRDPHGNATRRVAHDADHRRDERDGEDCVEGGRHFAGSASASR